MMASIYIKDSDTTGLAREIAQRRGTSKTAAVIDALLRRERTLDAEHDGGIHERLRAWRAVQPLGKPTGSEADKAFCDSLKRYGKASGHPAGLSMGDRFAYAGAKTNNARLLYKGNDFAQTDLA